MIYQRLLKIEHDLDQQETELKKKRTVLKEIKKLLADNIDEKYEMIPDKSLNKLKALFEELKQSKLTNEEMNMLNMITKQ